MWLDITSASPGYDKPGLVHSTTLEVQPFHEDLPFDAIADPEKHFYRLIGAEKSFFASLHPSVLWAAFLSSIKGRVGLKMRGGPFGLPAEFLLASDGRILAAKYGLHAYDQWSVDELVKLAATTNESYLRCESQ